MQWQALSQAVRNSTAASSPTGSEAQVHLEHVHSPGHACGLLDSQDGPHRALESLCGPLMGRFSFYASGQPVVCPTVIQRLGQLIRNERREVTADTTEIQICQ